MLNKTGPGKANLRSKLAGLMMVVLVAVGLVACGDNTPASSSASTGGGGGVKLDFPGVSGVKEVSLDGDIRTYYARQLGLDGVNVQMFTSDDPPTKFTSSAATYLAGQGYVNSLPGVAGPGLYTKSGTDDVLVVANAVPQDVGTALTGSSVNADSVKKLAEQFKGKQSLLIALSGQNLKSKLEGIGGATVAPVVTGVQRGLGSPPPTPTK